MDGLFSLFILFLGFFFDAVNSDEDLMPCKTNIQRHKLIRENVYIMHDSDIGPINQPSHTLFFLRKDARSNLSRS